MKHLLTSAILLLTLLMPQAIVAADNDAAVNNPSFNETISSNAKGVVFGDLDTSRGELEIHYVGSGPANMYVYLNGELTSLSNSVLSLPAHGSWDIGVLIEFYGPAAGRSSFVVSHHVEFKYDTPAPVIRCHLQPKTVEVEIQWPQSDGYPVYTGQYVYPRTHEDQFFDVEAFMTDNGRHYESDHMYDTIWVPALDENYEPSGDVNDDGRFDINDITDIIQLLLSSTH